MDRDQLLRGLDELRQRVEVMADSLRREREEIEQRNPDLIEAPVSTSPVPGLSQI